MAGRKRDLDPVPDNLQNKHEEKGPELPSVKCRKGKEVFRSLLLGPEWDESVTWRLGDALETTALRGPRNPKLLKS